MKMKYPKFEVNHWIVLGTLIFFVLAYIVYLQYYVPAKEGRIVSTRFRVLDKMGENLDAKLSSYKSNVSALGPKIQDTVTSLKKKVDLVKHLQTF